MILLSWIFLLTIWRGAGGQSSIGFDPFADVVVPADDKCGYDEQIARMQLELLGDHWGYSYDSLLADLADWAQSPYVTIDSLGASVQNRPIWQLTITDNQTPSEPRRVIHVHARTHPGEVQAWWVTDEMINFLLSDDEFARFLRANCLFYILPMYNPDGVELEYPRWNANGVDLESNWNAPTVEPEVAVLRSRFIELMSAVNPIEVALNMHSAVACKRYFVYHDAVGTSPAFAVLERNFIEGIRYYFLQGIEPWNYYISWKTGTPTQYPESWFWLNHGEAVMALTYEDMNCSSAGFYDQTAYALLHGTADFLGLVSTALITDEEPVRQSSQTLRNYPNPIYLSSNQPLSTVVQYQLHSSQDIRLSVYDVLGREIFQLDKGYQTAGEHRVFFDASRLPNGIYFFSLQTQGKRIIRKFSVIR